MKDQTLLFLRVARFFQQQANTSLGITPFKICLRNIINRHYLLYCMFGAYKNTRGIYLGLKVIFK